MTALIGAPLLLWLLPRLRSMSAPSMDVGDNVPTERQNVQWFALAGLVVLLLGVLVALSFGRDAEGWRWISGTMLDDLMQWRLPRIIAALTAGIMLAVAGCIIQRLTGTRWQARKCWGSAPERPSVLWSCCSSCRGMRLAG
jgi:iron complex transport system permease protein